jgi:hypothetical protein
MYNLYKFGKERRTRLLRQSTLRSWRGICQMLLIVTALCSLSAKAAWYQFSSIAALRAQSTSGLVDGDLAFTTGYYSASDRGGGWFTWQASSTHAEDGGSYIVPGSNPGSGRWVRLMNGEISNIRMWGAKGDGSHNDTTNFLNAMAAYTENGGLIGNTSGELIIPRGSYNVTNTIVFPNYLHIKGEGPQGNSAILMLADVDAFRTANASNALAGYAFDWDHGVLFENLAILFPSNASTAAGLVLCQPGEAHTIRNINVEYGGYGVRSFGVGAPGLKIYNVSASEQRVAGVSIEGNLPNGTAVSGSGPVSIFSLSGDFRETNSQHAALLRITNCVPTVSVYDFKAEGWWTDGIINYRNLNLGPGDVVGSLNVYGGYYNGSGTNCDFVVVGSPGLRTPSVYLSNVNLYNARYLIRDDLTGRNIYPYIQQVSGLQQTTARAPVQYESFLYPTNLYPYYMDAPPRSRYIVGGEARVDLFTPVTNAWYRVMRHYVGHMGGRLNIRTYSENTELQVDNVPNITTGGVQLDILRKSLDSGWSFQPAVTKARAGSYYDGRAGGSVSFLDIYVERSLDSGQPLTLSHPFSGEGEDAGMGETELLAPTAPLTSLLPPNCTLNVCVTNVLTR